MPINIIHYCTCTDQMDENIDVKMRIKYHNDQCSCVHRPSELDTLNTYEECTPIAKIKNKKPQHHNICQTNMTQMRQSVRWEKKITIAQYYFETDEHKRFLRNKTKHTKKKIIQK